MSLIKDEKLFLETPLVNVLKAAWAFKRRINPEGILDKHKARVCTYGIMQLWGEYFWE